MASFQDEADVEGLDLIFGFTHLLCCCRSNDLAVLCRAMFEPESEVDLEGLFALHGKIDGGPCLCCC